MGANGKSIKLPKFITPKVCQGWINSRKLIIPINLGQTVVRKNKNGQPQSTGSHWVLGVINFEAKKIQYYDSYRNTNATFFKVCLKNNFHTHPHQLTLSLVYAFNAS
jgi:uncharacterized protein YvpB